LTNILGNAYRPPIVGAWARTTSQRSRPTADRRRWRYV
jgi:hypothetical protein